MADQSLEQQIIERFRHLSESQKHRVLHFVERTLAEPSSHTSREMIRLPSEERERLVAAAFEAAAGEDFEIFEAYSEEAPDD